MGMLDPNDQLHVRMGDESQEYVLVTPDTLDDLNAAHDVLEDLCDEADIDPDWSSPGEVFQHLSRHDFIKTEPTKAERLMQDWQAHIELDLHEDARIVVPEDFDGSPVSLSLSDELREALEGNA